MSGVPLKMHPFVTCLLFYSSHRVSGIGLEPDFSRNIFFFYVADACVPAVLAVISIIAQHKVFVFPHGNGLFRQSGVFNGFSVGAFQRVSIDINDAVLYLDRISRLSNDPFYVITGFFVSIGIKGDDISRLCT